MSVAAKSSSRARGQPRAVALLLFRLILCLSVLAPAARNVKAASGRTAPDQLRVRRLGNGQSGSATGGVVRPITAPPGVHQLPQVGRAGRFVAQPRADWGSEANRLEVARKGLAVAECEAPPVAAKLPDLAGDSRAFEQRKCRDADYARGADGLERCRVVVRYSPGFAFAAHSGLKNCIQCKRIYECSPASFFGAVWQCGEDPRSTLSHDNVPRIDLDRLCRREPDPLWRCDVLPSSRDSVSPNSQSLKVQGGGHDAEERVGAGDGAESHTSSSGGGSVKPLAKRSGGGGANSGPKTNTLNLYPECVPLHAVGEKDSTLSPRQHPMSAQMRPVRRDVGEGEAGAVSQGEVYVDKRREGGAPRWSEL